MTKKNRNGKADYYQGKIIFKINIYSEKNKKQKKFFEIKFKI